MKTLQRYECNTNSAGEWYKGVLPKYVQADWGPVCKVEDIRAVFERLRKVETREALLRILEEEQP